MCCWCKKAIKQLGLCHYTLWATVGTDKSYHPGYSSMSVAQRTLVRIPSENPYINNFVYSSDSNPFLHTLPFYQTRLPELYTEWCSLIENTKSTNSYSLKWFTKIYIGCNLWFSKFTPLENEIYPRLRATGLQAFKSRNLRPQFCQPGTRPSWSLTPCNRSCRSRLRRTSICRNVRCLVWCPRAQGQERSRKIPSYCGGLRLVAYKGSFWTQAFWFNTNFQNNNALLSQK